MSSRTSDAEGPVLASKYRGCLLGALLGDCLGSPFEYIADATASELQNFFDAIVERQPALRSLFRFLFRKPKKFEGSNYRYTDDTAMTICIAESFVSKGTTFDLKDVAMRFVDEYYASSSRRGEYGVHVRDVFRKLRSQNCADPLMPATEQFNGAGSFGNGGAMRVAPVALFYHKDFQHMLYVAEQITRITHTHPFGINGAILQCIAVHQALTLDPAKGPLDINSFLENLILKMHEIEKSSKEHPYQEKLQKIKELLSEGDVDIEKVKMVLGNNMSAHGSVPTAIYSFLRAQKPIPNIKAHNKFHRTIQYAIFCGGDTDTIASMAGAIAGAYFGEHKIKDSLREYCEGVQMVLKLADDLFKVGNSE